MWIAGKFLVMMVLFFLAVYFCIEGQQAAKTVTVILNGKALEYDQAVLICEQEKNQTIPLETCFWGEVSQQDVSCPATGKSCSLTEIVTIDPVRGSIFHGVRCFQKLPEADDKAMCARRRGSPSNCSPASGAETGKWGRRTIFTSKWIVWNADGFFLLDQLVEERKTEFSVHFRKCTGRCPALWDTFPSFFCYLQHDVNFYCICSVLRKNSGS